METSEYRSLEEIILTSIKSILKKPAAENKGSVPIRDIILIIL